MAFLKFVVLFLFAAVIGYSLSQECTLDHINGCTYTVVLKETTCKRAGQYGMIGDSPKSKIETKPQKENDVKDRSNENESVKKLDHMEKKLTKMMDSLSVRSLRHMRKIRSEMKQMATAIRLLKGTRKRRSESPLECPPDFLRFGTWPSCYKFSTFKAMWREAREYCTALGANLVALETAKEQYVIDYFIKNNAEYQEAVGWWTSGSYVPRSRHWMWTSQHHLKPMSAMSWAPGEPDDRSTNHCMILFKPTKYKWNDALCSNQYNFICELDLSAA